MDHNRRRDLALHVLIADDPATKMNFGRMDSDYHVEEHQVQIGNQDTLSGLTFDQMEQQSTVRLPMTREAFQQMWKTVILKRVQDVVYASTQIVSAHPIILSRSLKIPAPLSDLLESLGTFISKRLGSRHYLTEPTYAAANVWTAVDNEILRQWSQLMGRISNLYEVREFPVPSNFGGDPLMFCFNAANADGSNVVHAYTDEPTIEDAIITACNDALFGAHGYITAANSNIVLSLDDEPVSFQARYVAEYALNVNS